MLSDFYLYRVVPKQTSTDNLTFKFSPFSYLKGSSLMKKALSALSVAAATLTGAAFADDADTVRAFYTDILTDPAETTSARYFEIFSPDVVSIPTPPGGEGAQGMLNTVAFLGQTVPDLEWNPQEIINLNDGRFVVRSLFSGTPIGPFLGVDPVTGKSFEAMSIDILTVTDGRITHVYHLEDWTGVIAQLNVE